MSLSATTYILQALAAGDFNGDGQDDLALAVDNISVFPIRGEVLVLRNTGSGNFAAPVDIRLAGGLLPRCIEAVDVTGDDALDLVVCHARVFNDVAEGQISLLVGQTTAGVPTGAFARVFTGSVGTAPSAVAAGDLDGDGRQDLAVADPESDAVYLLYGIAGAGTFAAPVLLEEMIDPIAVLIDTLPGQALPRVLAVTRQGGRLRTFAQVAPRVFAAPTSVRIGLLPAAAGLGHLDQDNLSDLVVLSVQGAELWYGRADGGFTFGETLTRDSGLTQLAIDDLDGDGTLDVAAAAVDADRVTVVLNGADVPSTPAPTPTVTPTSTITVTPTRTPTGVPGTPTATMTGTLPTATATATPSATPVGGVCPGDCGGDRMVTVNELIVGVNIALGNAAAASCPAFDRNGDGQVTVNELIAAVNAALTGCPAAS